MQRILWRHMKAIRDLRTGGERDAVSRTTRDASVAVSAAYPVPKLRIAFIDTPSRLLHLSLVRVRLLHAETFAPRKQCGDLQRNAKKYRRLSGIHRSPVALCAAAGINTVSPRLTRRSLPSQSNCASPSSTIQIDGCST